MDTKDEGINTDWVEQVIAKLQGSSSSIMQLQVGDQNVVATLAPEFIQFFQQNKALLLRMGLDCFQQFVMLISEHKEEEAFDLVAQKMDADDIIAKINMTANELQQHNDLMDQWEASLKQFAISLLTGAASKLILGMLPLPPIL
jgi:hypothetical protein